MNLPAGIFMAFLMGTPAVSVNGQTISNESKLLAECEFIYSYTAQVMQLRNNSGAAVSILRRSTIMTTANMMSNAVDGKIPAWKIKTWTELRPALKDELDSRRLDPLMQADRCDRDVMPIALNIRDLRLQLWGHDFDSLQHQFMKKLRTSTGI
jgi:hypothetical protein